MAKTPVRTAVVIGTLVLAGAAAALAQQAPVEFTGNIVNMQGGGTARIRLHVDSYTPDEEIQQYVGALQANGMDGVMKLMWKAKECGWVKIGSQLGYPVEIVRIRPTEKGHLIVAVTDRPIQFFELRNGVRSMDYPLGMVILEIDKDGKGEGKVIAAAKANFTKDGKVELESYGTEPLRVIRVATEPVKPKK